MYFQHGSTLQSKKRETWGTKPVDDLGVPCFQTRPWYCLQFCIPYIYIHHIHPLNWIPRFPIVSSIPMTSPNFISSPGPGSCRPVPRSWLGRELAVRGDVEPPHLGGDGNNMGKSWEKHGVLLEVLPVFAILVNLDVTYIYTYINLCEPVYFTWKTMGKWSYNILGCASHAGVYNPYIYI